MLPEKRIAKESVFLVRGKAEGKEAWHYVEVERIKPPLFQEALKSGTVNIIQYGTILRSGWGNNPPQDIVDAMHKRCA